MSKHVEKKCWKLQKLFPIIKDRKGAEFLQNLKQKMTLELYLKFMKRKSNKPNFSSANISKYLWEKCGKLCICSILSSQRGITPLKIYANQWHSNMICSSLKERHAKFQLNTKHVEEKCGKRCIFSILNSKRSITLTKIDANQQHSNLIYLSTANGA